MGSTEAVKEMHKGNTALHGRKMCHCRQVCCFLHTAGRKLRESCLPARHYVGVITENAQGMRTDRTGCHMQYRRKTLACDPVQHRNHQHQSLARGIARCQRAGLQRAMDGTDGTGFRLHFDQTHALSEHVFPAVGAPFIRCACHRGRRRDRIDRRDLGEFVSNMSRSAVAVNRHIIFSHSISFS